MMHGTTNIKFR